ncbi:MAG: prolyl oligopeptidase family serine peptidase [Bacteroidota bacterium]
MRNLSIYFFLIAYLFYFRISAQIDTDALFEDVPYESWGDEETFFKSKKVDFLQIPSSISDSVKFAIVVYKPDRPSRVLLTSHGWHMSVRPPNGEKNPYPNFLTVQVDMRGRKYSTGKQDCNGYELYDFYDAYRYVVNTYEALVQDPEQVYFAGGSGAGGNGLGLVGKFPDLFCSAVIRCGMSDYAAWYRQDTSGEFRDEMLPWIGATPEQNPEAYNSRSGIAMVENLITPLYISHGETDIRVPSSHSRNYVEKAKKMGKKVDYIELQGVGTRKHWGNIAPEQERLKAQQQEKGLREHPTPKLKAKGELLVPGFVVTKHFSVFMDSIDHIGLITYNLPKSEIAFSKGKGKVVWH